MNSRKPDRSAEIKRRILDELLAIHAQDPDLRFGQIIENARSRESGVVLFYIEDEDLLAALKAFGDKREAVDRR